MIDLWEHVAFQNGECFCKAIIYIVVAEDLPEAIRNSKTTCSYLRTAKKRDEPVEAHAGQQCGVEALASLL